MKFASVRFALIASLTVVLSLSASACEFTAGTTTTGDSSVAYHGTTDADQSQRNVGPEAATLSGAYEPTLTIQATPELDSLALFGSGLLAAGAYVRRRYRLLPRE
jgi:hypothetical protein